MAQKFTVPITVKQLSSAGSDAITVYVDQDTYSRLKIEAGGRLTWGPGASAGDVNLYRDEANVLKTDDTFKAPALFVDGIEIDPTGATTDQVLKFNGTKFVPGTDGGGGGGASTLDELTDVTAPTPASGDFLKFNGSVWVNDAIDLGTDTTGDYISSITAGTGISVDFTPGEGAGASVSLDATLKDLTDTGISEPADGEFLKYNGSVWVNDAIDLGTDTTGDYVSSITAGTGISVDFTPGEGAGASVSLNASLTELNDTTITDPTAGDFLKWNGSAWVNDDIDLGTDTVGDYVQSLVAGTNVIITNNSGEGATPTISISGNIGNFDSISTPDYVQFDTSVVGASSNEGRLQWDSDFGSLSFGLEGNDTTVKIGFDNVAYCYNADSVTLTKGTPVFISGGQGSQVAIQRAYNTSDAGSARTLGLVSESIAPTASGYVVTHGVLTGINTSIYSVGDILYLGATPGTLTTTKPHAPNHYVFIGVVIKVGTGGEIWIRPQNGYELDEIHDVDLVTTPPVSGDFLKYNGTLWVNDAINLGTDTVGNYVSSVTAGTGISVNFTPSEDAGASVSLNATIDQLNDVTAPSPSSGDFLKWNGSAWVNDAIDLGTDTTGNYMVGVTAGTGISVTHTPGEGSTATVGLNATLDDLSNVTVTGASAGNVLTFDGSIWTAASAASGGGASVTVSDAPPASPSEGDLWFESDTTRTYVYYDSFWVEIGSTGSGATVSDTAPTNPIQGQIWLNSLNGATYVYYSPVWIEVGAVPVNTLLSTIQAKGDLLVGTASATVDNLTVGNNGDVLTVDSSTATGLKWAPASGGGGGLNTSSEGALLIMDIGV